MAMPELIPLADPGSLSARRAWIEINLHCVEEVSGDSRSPQGERG